MGNVTLIFSLLKNMCKSDKKLYMKLIVNMLGKLMPLHINIFFIQTSVVWFFHQCLVLECNHV